MNTVELKTAYSWTCPQCNTQHFATPVKADLTPEEKEECYREFHDLESWQELPANWSDFELVSIPDQVTCTKCGIAYNTIDERN